MLARFKRMAIAALLIMAATGITIKKADPNSIKNFAEQTNSRSSLLRHFEGKNEEKPTVVNFDKEESSLRLPEPCLCRLNDLKQTLATFNGPNLIYSPTYRGGKAQILTLPVQISDSLACRLADGSLMCGQPSYTFTDLESGL
jgi:hypothetical protein